MMRGLVLLLALSTVVTAGAARAAERRGPDPHAQAAAHYRLGSTRYAEGDYAGALDQFQAGYAAEAAPAFLVNIGQCLRKLDRLDEAALAFRRFLDARTGTQRVRLDVWDALEDVIDALNRRVDQLAEDVALFRAYLATGQGDAAMQARVRRTVDDVVHELVRIDDTLVGGYGVARGLALPRVHLPRGTASGPEVADRVRRRLQELRRSGRRGARHGRSSVAR
jgi:tetratricopeptide (TPR) repeat protein